MKKALVPVALFALATGCRALPEPVCQSSLLVPVLSATGPRTATLGQPVSYTLRVRLGNSCGAFDSIAVSLGDNLSSPYTRQVAVQAQYTGCSCQADTTTVTQVSYRFQPAKAGTYYVQFLSQQYLKRQPRFITDTLTVR